MKNYILLTLMLAWGFNQLSAQCPATAVEIDCNAGPVSFFATSPTNCVVAANCSGLITEYLIVSTVDTVILGTTQTTSFDPTLYEGECVSVQPVCYDLQIVQNFVEQLNNGFLGLCCTAVDGQTPAGLDPICTTVTGIYTSGSQVQDMDDVLIILGAFGGDTLTLRSLAATIDSINLQAPTIGIICSGVSEIGYCLDTDPNLATNAFDICPPGCPADLILTGTTADPLYSAGNTITSDAVVPGGSNVGYQAGTEILMDTPFMVEPNADFSAEIVPCVPFAGDTGGSEN